jgi:hypothetical protein
MFALMTLCLVLFETGSGQTAINDPNTDECDDGNFNPPDDTIHAQASQLVRPA